MSLFPAFELGLWNAWILNLPELFFWPVGSKILKRRETSTKTSRLDKKRKDFTSVLRLTIFISYIYSVFLPLKPRTYWFYPGLILYLVGMFIEIIALHNFMATPADKPVTTGIYRVSRNPMYIGEFLKCSGIGLACVSWIYMSLAITQIILWHHLVLLEEHECLEKYGRAYREYINKTPRWIGIPQGKRL